MPQFKTISTFQSGNIQSGAGFETDEACEKVQISIVGAADAHRPASGCFRSLYVGIRCLVGITANPALGEACDLLVAQGTGVLAETPEIMVPNIC